MTISDVFTQLTVILGSVWSVFGNIVSTITGNALLYVPVLLGLGITLVMFCISVVKKLGIKGISAAGGRRRRRAR